MKRLKIVLAFIFAGFAFLSCSSPVHVQKDDSVNLANYHTYMWVDTKADENDNSPRSTAYIDLSMKNAVNRELEKKGWKEVADNPDVFLNYDVLVEKSVEQRTDPVYSRPFTRAFYNRFRGRWVTVYYPSQFVGYQSYNAPVKEGTITLTMTDAKTDKVAWQGWTTRNLGNSRITENEVARSATSILQKLQPA